MDALSTISLILVAAGFGAAAYFSYRREWKFGFSFSLVVFALAVGVALPNTRAFMRTTAWAAFVTALESTGQGLIRLTKAVDDIRTGVKNDQGELDKVQKQTQEMQASLGVAQGLIQKQQKELGSQQEALQKQQEKLADLDQLITSIYEARRSEIHEATQDSSTLVAVKHDDTHVDVYVSLDSPPIPQTVDLQWHVFAQPKDSFMIYGNVLIFRWGQSLEVFRSHPLTITYVPMPKQNSIDGELSLKDSRVFIGSEPLIYGYYNLDPVFVRLVKQAKGDGSKVTIEAYEAAVKAEYEH